MNTIKILILLLFLLFFANLKTIYVFSDNYIFNLTKNNKINNTILEIFDSGEYIIKGNCENSSIIINANYVTIYIINSHLNSGFKPLIIVNENINNIIIYLDETILSSSFDSGIIQLKDNSHLIINSKSSIIKGGIIIKGTKKFNLKINGIIGLKDRLKQIKIDVNIYDDFIFQCENEKIKFDHIYMEISSDSYLKLNTFCIKNSSPFGKNINDKSSQIYDKEIQLNIKIQKLFEKEIKIKENNTFYLDYLYFKHINIAKEKSEVKILKKSQFSFKPKVSVIIPIYNVQNYLALCLDSIVNQILKEIEIICVNDGSTDDSLFILLNYSKIDNRIIIVEQRNRGLSEARNIGVKYSNGEFIYFIDSDDLLEHNALFELYEYGTKYNLDVIYFQFFKFRSKVNLHKNYNVNSSNFILNHKNIMKGKHLFVKLRKKKRYNPSVCISFFKKQFYINAGLSFYPGILHEDELFTLTGILLAKRATFINKKYYYYRMHGSSIMHKKKNIKNLYGCLISYYGMVNKFNGVKFEKSVRKAIKTTKNNLKKVIRKTMKVLSLKEKKILSIILNNAQKKMLSAIIKKKFYLL